MRRSIIRAGRAYNRRCTSPQRAASPVPCRYPSCRSSSSPATKPARRRPASGAWRSPTSGSSSIRAAATTPARSPAALGAQRRAQRRLAGLRRAEEPRPRVGARATGCLSIDADERVSAATRAEHPRAMRRARARQADAAGYELSRLSSFCGHWMRHGDWYPDRVLRLFRRDARPLLATTWCTSALIVDGADAAGSGRTAARDHADAATTRCDKMNRYSTRPRARHAARRAARRPGRGALGARRCGPSCAAMLFAARLSRRARCGFVLRGLRRRGHLLPLPEDVGMLAAKPARDIDANCSITMIPSKLCEPCSLHAVPVAAAPLAVAASALPARAQFRVEISGVGAHPVADRRSPRFRDEDKRAAAGLGHRPRRPRAQRPVPRRRRHRRARRNRAAR